MLSSNHYNYIWEHKCYWFHKDAILKCIGTSVSESLLFLFIDEVVDVVVVASGVGVAKLVVRSLVITLSNSFLMA